MLSASLRRREKEVGGEVDINRKPLQRREGHEDNR